MLSDFVSQPAAPGACSLLGWWNCCLAGDRQVGFWWALLSPAIPEPPMSHPQPHGSPLRRPAPAGWPASPASRDRHLDPTTASGRAEQQEAHARALAALAKALRRAAPADAERLRAYAWTGRTGTVLRTAQVAFEFQSSGEAGDEDARAWLREDGHVTWE